MLPHVRESRDVLLMRPLAEAPSLPLLTSLAFALQRAIQVVHQVEEQEVAVEIIGQGQSQQILFWEAAEGGTAVAERLFEDPRSSALAQEALRICHIDPMTGEDDAGWDARCSAACYDCLLRLDCGCSPDDRAGSGPPQRARA